MTFISMPLGDAKDKEVLPEGTYELIIEDAQLVENDDGTPQCVSIRHSVDGEPDAKAVWHRIWFPKPDADAEKRNNTLLFNKAYCNLFEIPWTKDGFNLDDFPGARGRVLLVQDEYEGVTSNQIKLRI